MERKFIQQQIKDRTKCFGDNNFPCRAYKCDRRQHMLTQLAKDISLISAYEKR